MLGLYQIDPNANSPWDDIGPKAKSAQIYLLFSEKIHEQSETFLALSKGISHLKDPLGSVLVKEESPKE